jgi:hypothetical protein
MNTRNIIERKYGQKGDIRRKQGRTEYLVELILKGVVLLLQLLKSLLELCILFFS